MRSGDEHEHHLVSSVNPTHSRAPNQSFPPQVEIYKLNMPSMVHATSYEILERLLGKTFVSW